uniref:Major facilitator superfamily (MFS) profile domain-containing protein n=1 Tax=Candidozyma auris TaxID=498019 RepID=A0A0L0NRH1_CANAR
MVLNPGYRVRNLLALNFAGFACISLVVFLLASQPFYLSDVIGVDLKKIGSVVGTLGVLDELTSIFVAVFLGTFNDKLNFWARSSTRFFPSGPRILELGGFLLLAASLFGYGKLAHSVFPDLWFWRAIFAVAVTACMSIVTVMLHEANNSDFAWTDLAFWRMYQHKPEHQEVEEGLLSEEPAGLSHPQKKKHGKLSAMIGVSTGLGAVFSVSFFLTLPVKLSDHNDDLTREGSVRLSYVLLGVFAFAAAVLVFTFAYDSAKHRKAAGVGGSEQDKELSYLELLKQGLQASKYNRRVQLAYVSSFVSRSTTVANSVFIPLMVFKFYSEHGKCSGSASESANTPLKDECYDGYVFSAILTGVAQTVALVSSPLWGILVDSNRLGCLMTLLIAAASGMLGSFGLCLASVIGGDGYDPRNAVCFILVSFIGLSQIGTIIASMSLVSSIGLSIESTEHRVIGSISGCASVCGGFGILLITKVGGSWSDHWTFGPFFILGLLNVILAAASILATRK